MIASSSAFTASQNGGPDDQALELPACGQPLSGHEIAWSAPCQRDWRTKEIGSSFEVLDDERLFPQRDQTESCVWLDTSDRGYMTSRASSSPTHQTSPRRQHLYPQEIEEAVATIPGVHKGSVAVFRVTDASAPSVVAGETRETDPSVRSALQARAHEVVTDAAGTPPDEIVLAPPRTVPKTSSGKIRRSAARELYESGHIGPTQRVLWWQLLRLAASGTGPQLRRFGRLRAKLSTPPGGGRAQLLVRRRMRRHSPRRRRDRAGPHSD
jgi:hypothetical protein